jgi:hypothetical protein
MSRRFLGLNRMVRKVGTVLGAIEIGSHILMRLGKL